MYDINKSITSQEAIICAGKEIDLEKGASATLNTDSKVNTHAFSPTFDMESFIEFVFTDVLMLMTQGSHS